MFGNLGCEVISMRTRATGISLLCLLPGLLGLGCNKLRSLAAQVSETEPSGMRRTGKASLDNKAPLPRGAWAEGLTNGPNGPIPVIVVDQFGYRPNDPKFAFVRDPRWGYDSHVDFTPGSTYALVEAKSGAIVKKGPLSQWNSGNICERSGDVVWKFDFSDVQTPGTYYVEDLERKRRSPEFVIDQQVYREVLRHAFRTFFYQRAGFEKTAAKAGAEWADGASHLGPGQDGEAHAWLDRDNDSKRKDLRGGWYDAGDYNKYTNWHARYVITLLRTFTRHPKAFGDDFGIPESGNGVSDLLDEVTFGLSWLKRMQNADGSVLNVQALGHGSPPSSATDPSFYGPPTTSATLSSAAAFAYAARVFAGRPEPGLAAAAADYLARAKRAWDFAATHPNLVYFNNDENAQPGSGGLAAGQQEVDDGGRLAWKVEAASYLFEHTGEEKYRTFFDENYEKTVPVGASHWEIDRHEIVLDYAAQKAATPSVAAAIRARFLTGWTGDNGLFDLTVNHRDAYRAPIQMYTWGSNQSKAAAGRLYLLVSEYELDPPNAQIARAAAADYLHYLHGANPLGLVYLTNMARAGAEHSAKTLYHAWFSQKSARWSEVTASTPGPAPGFLVGGPNPSFALDGCCSDGSKCYGSPDFSFCSMNFSPPIGQTDQKSYLQFNHGWPAGSWAVTENSNGYQVQYIRLLAGFVD